MERQGLGLGLDSGDWGCGVWQCETEWRKREEGLDELGK